MKIMMLAQIHSVHTIRWANSLSDRGIEILVCGFLKSDNNNFIKDHYNNKIKVIDIAHSGMVNDQEGSYTKLIYLKALPVIRKAISEFKPDILHAHYASSYGLLGALSNFHPFIVSLWGADVITFPDTSIIHKLIFKFNLKKADRILSTSNFMVKKLSRYSRKPAKVTPFGVDTNIFKPGKRADILTGNYDCVIGTIKGLDWHYGIEYLIRAFKILKERLNKKKLLLVIVGGGVLESKLKEEIRSLGLENDVLMTGKIAHSLVPEYHNSLDIFAALSVFPETFGVSVVEASACGKPVVVTNMGGLPEVVDNGVTGFIVGSRDAEAAADKIEKLICDPALRERMGKAGREKVKREYQWSVSVDKMIDVYKEVLLITG